MIKNFTENETSAFSKAILGEKSGDMKIVYRTGQKYLITSNVPENTCKGLFADFLGAESKGKFFSQFIKNNPNFTVTRL